MLRKFSTDDDDPEIDGERKDEKGWEKVMMADEDVRSLPLEGGQMSWFPSLSLSG